MIWMRADGGERIGTGHIMRCLSIARALKELGEPVCFLSADREPVPLLEAQEQEYLVLGTSYQNPMEDWERLDSVLERGEDSLFFADGYFFSPQYLQKARERMPVCLLDDLGTDGMPVDLLINYHIFAQRTLYGNKGQGTAYLLGPRFAPLRKEFGEAFCPPRQRARRVLITTGGSDRYDLAGKILESILRHPGIRDMEYCVVSGAFNRYLPHLRELEKGHPGVRVYSNVENMIELMQQCDIAVTAGGTTLYELCAVGLPAVCFSFVDNQKKIVEEFQRQGIVCCGGDYGQLGDQLASEVAGQVARLASDVVLRRSLSERGHSLVDGGGAMRIARQLQALLHGTA